MTDYKGKVALVTGGTRGLGKEIARKFLEGGARVAISFHRDIEGAEETKRDFAAFSDQVLIEEANATDWKAMEKICANIHSRFSSLDILVNNAGITKDRRAIKMTKEDWDEVIAVNLSGPFYASRLVLEGMITRRWGRIINISSVIGQAGNYGQTNYSASKAGLFGLTKSLAREVAEHGVLVNAIAAGFMNTGMTAPIPEKVREKIYSRILLGKFGEPTDVAELVLFLSSEKAGYITGQTFNVDGGYFG